MAVEIESFVASGNTLAGNGRFTRLPTIQRFYKLSHSNYWIIEKISNGERNILCLPFGYGPSCIASRRGILAMGYPSGKTFRMKIRNDDNEAFAKDICVWGGELGTDEDEEIDKDKEKLDVSSDQVKGYMIEDSCVWEGAIDSDAESLGKGASERFSGGEQLERQMSGENYMREEEIDESRFRMKK